MRLWYEWSKDAIPVNEAKNKDEKTARKVEETEVVALMNAAPPVACLTYETVEDLPAILIKAMGEMAMHRTIPTTLLGALPEEEVPCKDWYSKWKISFHNVPGWDPGHFYLFNSDYELYSPIHQEVFNITGAVVEIRRKEKANA
jgi:hypothetical protein